MAIPAIIDLEASGFGKGSYPIEVAYALPDKNIASYLICPHPSWTHWNAEAQEIHGISREQLQQEGRDVYTVAYELNESLAGFTLYSDAWGFDSSWIAKLFDAAGLISKFRLETLNRLLTPEQTDSWYEVKEQVSQELKVNRHRAANDVKVLQETYIRIKNENKNG